MIVDGNNQFLTQRQLPPICLIAVLVDAQGLSLSAPGQDGIDVEFPVRACRRQVTVWRDQVIAQDCGDAAADWLTAYLGQACRLVFMPNNFQRGIDPEFPARAAAAELVSFADGFPLLLTCEASLLALNKRLPQPIAMERFRPNVVIAGGHAFAEDDWKLLRIGNVEFSVVKPCARCAIPSIDPVTATRQPAVLKTLAAFRRRGNAVYFGQNLTHHHSGVIEVGDSVEVLE